MRRAGRFPGLAGVLKFRASGFHDFKLPVFKNKAEASSFSLLAELSDALSSDPTSEGIQATLSQRENNALHSNAACCQLDAM